MSHMKNAVELCALIVDEVYGELASRIFAVLLRRGRLTIGMLIQQTKLPAKHIQNGLAVLVQHFLVYYLEEEQIETTFYEANIEAAYSLIQFGKILDVVHSRLGHSAREIVDILLQFGHATVADVTKEYEKRIAEQAEYPPDRPELNGHSVVNGTNGEYNKVAINGTNGHHTALDDSRPPTEPSEAIWAVMEAGFVELVTPSMFRSPADNCAVMEREILQRDYGGSLKGTKSKEEFRLTVRRRLQELREEGRQPPSRHKRKSANGTNLNGEKRRRLINGHSTNGTDGDEGEKPDSTLVLRINLEKCKVALRSQKLAKLVEHHLGKTTAKVFAELLRVTEKSISRCRRDPAIDDEEEEGAEPGVTVTVMRLEQEMSPDIDVSGGIGRTSDDKVNTRNLDRVQPRRKRNYDDEAIAENGASSDEEDDDDDDVNEDGNIPEVDHEEDDGDDPFSEASRVKPLRTPKVTFQETRVAPEDRSTRLNNIKKHLQLLVEHSFIARCGSDGRGEYTVDFERLTEYMRKKELDTIIQQDFGRQGLRLYQILRQNGKLDEKTLYNTALIRQKDVRTKLAEMQRAGFIDVQEVPRDNSRAINRMIFLWYFDKDRVTTIVLDSIYKTMARSLEVLDCEKIQEHETITMAERSDIQGHEEEYLSNDAFRRLQAIRDKEEKILAQIGRLDELVGVFRDY